MSATATLGRSGRRRRRATAQVGVEIGATVVRAVIVRNEAICWTGARPWAPLLPGDDARSSEPDDERLASVLRDLLGDVRQGARATERRWRRRMPQGVERAPNVYVALSPTLVQLKRLTGLAPAADARQAAAAVRANVGQFFLANGTPLVTGGVRWAHPVTGDTHAALPHGVGPDATLAGADGWAAAYLTPAVATVVCACAHARLRLMGVGPVPVVLGEALATVPRAVPGADVGSIDDDVPHALWSDAGRQLAVWVDPISRQVDRVRRLPSPTSDAASVARGPSCPWHPALEAIGLDGGAFAAAFGAACVAGRPDAIDPVSLRFTRRGQRMIVAARRSAEATRAGQPRSARRPVPGWRLTIAGLACAVGLAAAGAAPGLAARRDARIAGAALRAVGPRRAAAAALAADLASANDVLRQAARGTAGGIAPLGVLAAIARVLPDGAALVDVQCDGPDGRLVALAPHAAALVDGLSRVPELDGVEIVGPVTREPTSAPTWPAVVPNAIPGPALSGGPGSASPASTLAAVAAPNPGTLERVAVRFRVRGGAGAPGRALGTTPGRPHPQTPQS